MREVATMAGVAVSSVSRVLAAHPDVSPGMRERVLTAVEALGYQPDFLAQSLRRGASLSLGFVMADISNPVMTEIAFAAEGVLRERGYAMMVMNSENDPELDAAHIDFFAARRVDGLMLSLASEQHRPTLRLLAKLSVPFVAIDRNLPARLGASAVLSDHKAGMRAAVTHLLDLGHRRILLVTGALSVRPAAERLAGMREAIAARGLADESTCVPGAFSIEHGATATAEALSLSVPPTAIIAGSNQLLIGCLRSLAARGLRAGQDVALVTCDDVPLNEFYAPPLAAISRDSAAIGRTAAELLLGRLDGHGDRQIVVLDTVFRPRASCSPARGQTPGAAVALWEGSDG